MEDGDSEEEDGRRIEKSQPPPVRINSNLMKIKMEEDYNPILAPKEEPVEGEVADMGEEQEIVSRQINKMLMGRNGEIFFVVKLYKPLKVHKIPLFRNLAKWFNFFQLSNGNKIRNSIQRFIYERSDSYLMSL